MRGPLQLTARSLSVDFAEKYRTQQQRALDYFCVECSDLQKSFLAKTRSHELLAS